MAMKREFPAFSLALVAAVILYVVATLVGQSYGWAFFSIPFFIGLIAGVLSKEHGYRDATYAFGAAVLLSVVFLREGVICLLFAAPLFVPGLYAGAACGMRISRYTKTRKQRKHAGTSLLVLGLCAQFADALMDDPARHPQHVASASMRLPASPERVFEVLTGEPLRVSGRWQWFLRVGLPMPSELAVTRPGAGGEVRVKFNHGQAIARITDFRPARAFAFRVTHYDIDDPPFHITRLGRGPHYGLRTERVEDWLTLQEVRYTLTRDERGDTLLTRELAWRRHLAPGFYFGWLQQTVMEKGQVRLLELIRSKLLERARGKGEQAVAARD